MQNQITFAHLADLHLGGWREKTLTNLNFTTFQKAIDKVLAADVDFCLFAGDIFNNALPPLDLVEKVVKEFLRLKKANIPLYVIGGSHDYSHTGKSFLQLLETAGVFIDVAKWETIDKGKVNLTFTKDEKTGTVLGGILGKKKGLDKNIYANLNSSELDDDNLNLFLFHCTLGDFKPDFMKAVKVDITSKLLPKGFDYYAGGHVHTYIEGTYDSGILCYPGPLFPNNFSEMKRETPCFNLCTYEKATKKIEIKREFLKTYEKTNILVDIKERTALETRELLEEEIKKHDVENKIVLLEIAGIVDGKISDIKLNEIVRLIYDKGALQVLKNTYRLTTKDLREIVVDEQKDIQTIEEEIIGKTLEDSSDKEMQTKLLKSLLSLDFEKKEGEKVMQFEERILATLEKALNR